MTATVVNIQNDDINYENQEWVLLWAVIFFSHVLSVWISKKNHFNVDSRIILFWIQLKMLSLFHKKEKTLVSKLKWRKLKDLSIYAFCTNLK